MRNFQFPISAFQSQRGFALLVSLVFMSVMLAFGLALSTLSYKQQQLASSAVQSQHAFYAADAALECALYADQQQNLFAYTSDTSAPAPALACDSAQLIYAEKLSHSEDRWVIKERLSFDSDARCADVTAYKPAGSGTTYLFAQGYSASCAIVENPGNARFTVRGVKTIYSSFAPRPCTTETFPYTGQAQTWMVPEGVTSVSIAARGAVGGYGEGGKGAEVTGILSVTPGERLVIYVGGKAGFNGGGYSGFYSGGGASDVRQGGTTITPIDYRVIVAGGGGGPGMRGEAGGASERNGQAGDDALDCGNGGGGGTQEAGGSGGQAGTCANFGQLGNVGSLGQGGDGGFFSGGGGGGYYGGGGGTAISKGGIKHAGGGGGSSLVPPGGTVITSAAGGDGVVTISTCGQ